LLEIDQDNMSIVFSPLDVDFSCLNFSPIGSRIFFRTGESHLGDLSKHIILLHVVHWGDRHFPLRTIFPFPGRFPPAFLHTPTFPPISSRVWRRWRHADRCCTAALPRGGGWQATDAVSDRLQRLTTTAAAAPFRASRCVRCRRCSGCPPWTCMSPMSTQILQRQLHTSCV